jgi:flagellar protein FlbT
MALKITLKPDERMIIGGAVVTNKNSTRCDLLVDNNIPILRQKDILNEDQADSPCRKIYFVIQLMYLDEENVQTYHKTYWNLVRDVVQAAPSMTGLIDIISEHILNQRYYQALKAAKTLIDYEQEAISCVQ